MSRLYKNKKNIGLILGIIIAIVIWNIDIPNISSDGQKKLWLLV